MPVLTADFIGAYECLMSLQDSVDVRRLIKYSMHLQDGQKYKRPEGVFVAVHPGNIRKMDNSSNGIARSGTMPSRPMARRSPKAQELQQQNQRPRANSMKRLPSVNKSSVLLRSESLSGTNHELGISDGYLEDDPVLLKMNVEYMVKVMAISRLKLQQYVSRLRESLPGSEREVATCLDGLEELCAFMEPRPQGNGANYASPPVERAYAADELENGRFQGTPPPRGEFTSTPKTTTNGRGVTTRGLSQQGAKTEFVRRAMVRDCDRGESFVVGEEENASESQTMIMTASQLNELSRSESTSSSSGGGGGSSLTNGGSGSGSFGSSYECPEHRIPRMAQRMIGNRREVELVEIVKGSEEGGHPLGKDFVPSTDPQGERRE